MRKIHPEPNAKFTRDEMQSVTTTVAGMWQNITSAERQQVQKEADKCKTEYETQKAMFPSAVLKKLARQKNKQKGTIVIPAQGERPVRAKTAYLIFCSKHRPKIMKEIHPDGDKKFTRDEMQNVTTKLAKMWKDISAKELKECQTQAKAELEKYMRLKEAYKPPVYGPGKKGALIRGKPAAKPKRSPTAYLVFAEELRTRLNAQHPTMNHVDVSKRIAADWKAIDPISKAAYQAKADARKEVPPHSTQTQRGTTGAAQSLLISSKHENFGDLMQGLNS